MDGRWEVIEPETPNQAQVKRRESGMTSDCKHQSESDKHGPKVGHSIRRGWGVVAMGGCYGWLLWVVAMGTKCTRRGWGGAELEHA